MSVDKFGRSSSNVISEGISLSQITNVFLRRDGGNIVAADIDVGAHKLTNVANPTHDKDAANKEYVDDQFASTKLYTKSNAGLIPVLHGNNNKHGFVPSASISSTDAWRVFTLPIVNEWVVPEDAQGDDWLQIKLPKAAKIHMFGVRGKRKEVGKELVVISEWKLGGSNDGEQFDRLFYATSNESNDDEQFGNPVHTPINNTTQFFDIDTSVGSKTGYLYYRLIIKQSSLPGPGISYFQLFSLDEVISGSDFTANIYLFRGRYKVE